MILNAMQAKPLVYLQADLITRLGLSVLITSTLYLRLGIQRQEERKRGKEKKKREKEERQKVS